MHSSEPTPPIAEVRPHQVPSPFGERTDPYYWLRDDTRQDPAMLAHLAAENAYYAAVMAPVEPLAVALFTEMRARIKEDDSSVPVFDRGYWYSTRYETGTQYPIVSRRAQTLEAPEEILLDGNVLAAGRSFYKLGNWKVSPDGKTIAWAEDVVGRNQFDLRVKTIATHAMYPDTAANISPSLAWANDNQTLFLVGKDPVTLRTDRVLRHVLGGATEEIFREPDGQFYVGVRATKSRAYISIMLQATTTSEVRLVDASKPTTPPVIFLPREANHEYAVDHLNGRFVIRTNAGAKNFRLVEVAEGEQHDRAAWRDLLPHSADIYLDGFALYDTFVAASVRTGGLAKVRVLPKGKPASFIDAHDPTYTMQVTDTPDPASTAVRYSYNSLTAPTTVFEQTVATGERTTLKVSPVPTYDPALYVSEYLHATAADGTQVPISLVYKRTTPRDGTAPLLVYAYGSYGLSMDPSYSPSVTSLLDRGWVYAIAHIRGGSELGRAWYEDGKLLRKQNTFTDFIAATEFLVAQQVGAADQIFAAGGSAGGLLMGAIANLRPNLYRGILTSVPFVDVVTTMLDESIPLTTNEYDEWGNPGASKAAYDYMLSYSPYDHLAAKAYPSIYVKTGLWDSQVQYYEPAKYVAKLRATKTDRNLLVMTVNMTAGHGGASGRFDALRERAREYAFALMISARADARTGPLTT